MTILPNIPFAEEEHALLEKQITALMERLAVGDGVLNDRLAHHYHAEGPWQDTTINTKRELRDYLESQIAIKQIA